MRERPPKMTRGHFEHLAQTLKDARELEPITTPAEAIDGCARLIADLCNRAGGFDLNGNRSFDRERFLKAAGVTT